MKVIQEPQALVVIPEITTLTASNAKEFKADLEANLEDTKAMVVDLATVTFIDSSGLGVLLFALKRLNQKGAIRIGSTPSDHGSIQLSGRSSRLIFRVGA